MGAADSFSRAQKRQPRQRRAAASQPRGNPKEAAAPPWRRGGFLRGGGTAPSPLNVLFCILFCTSRKVWPAAARCIAAGYTQNPTSASLRGPAFRLPGKQAKGHSRGTQGVPLENPPPGAAPEARCRYRVDGVQELRRGRSAQLRQCAARVRCIAFAPLKFPLFLLQNFSTICLKPAVLNV